MIVTDRFGSRVVVDEKENDLLARKRRILSKALVIEIS